MLWVAWALFLGASTALFINTVLTGRLPLAIVSRGWLGSATLTVSLFVVAAWWLLYKLLLDRRSSERSSVSSAAVVPAIPILLATTLPLVLIYVSDLLNHYFYYEMSHLNEPKTLTLLVLVLLGALLLQLLHLEMVEGTSLLPACAGVLERVREPGVLTLLALLGFLQVSAYLDRFYDDLILRYWPVADAMITGAPYPATVVAGIWRPYFVEGGLAEYLIDLPVYPAAVATSFAVFGHNVVAAYMPTVVANIALPPILYLLFREVTRNRCIALSLAGVVVLFPPMRLFVLNWTGPDPVFYVAFLASCWSYLRVSKGDSSHFGWALLGVSAAAMVLTRPEGVAYAGAYVCTAATISATRSRKLALGGLLLVPIGAFSLFMMVMFQMPWPRNWNSTFGVQNVVANWLMLSQGPIETAAQQMRLSTAELLASGALLLLAAFIGTLYLMRRQWRLAVLVVPAWVNVFTVLLVDPRVSGSYLWYDFFRHISYPLPLLVLAAGVAAEAAVYAIPRRSARAIGIIAMELLLLWLVVWNIHLMSKPAFSYGADAGNILGTGRLNFADLVIHHPFNLPVFEFAKVDGYWAVTAWRNTLWGYPDYLSEFFGSFDAVGRATGVAYETGSLFVYLAALGLASVHAAALSIRRLPGFRDYPSQSYPR